MQPFSPQDVLLDDVLGNRFFLERLNIVFFGQTAWNAKKKIDTFLSERFDWDLEVVFAEPFKFVRTQDYENNKWLE